MLPVIIFAASQMTSTHEEENLLEGMALTDTTSCPNPDHS